MRSSSNALFSQSTSSKARIFSAFEHLLEHEEFENVTVKQIYETAHVGKTTFYHHFRDKYDIVQWCTDLFFDLGVARIGRTLTWDQGHYISTNGYLRHQSLLKKAFRSKDYNGINSYSLRRREDNVLQTLEDYKHIKLTESLRMQIVALSAAETSVFHRYLVTHNSPDVDGIVDTMSKIVPVELYELLESPVYPNSEDPIERGLMDVNLIERVLSLPIERQPGKALSS